MCKMKRRVIIVSVILMLSLVLGGGTAGAAYNLTTDLPQVVAPGGGSFDFDVFLSSPSHPYTGWSFYFTIQGQSGQDGVDFNTSATENSKNDSSYIYYGNSYDYQCANVSGNTNSISCSDLSDDWSALNSGGLLAHVNVDYDATAVGNYNIVMGSSSFNSLIDGSFSEQFGGPAEGTILGTVSVAPEPISSALFIIGGATLGIRRFWTKKATI